MLQAIVFDFDGVIADSEPLHLRAYQSVLEKEGIELTRADYYNLYLGYDDSGLFQALAKDKGIAVKNGDHRLVDRIEGSNRRRHAVERFGAVPWRGGLHSAARPPVSSGDRVRRARAGNPAGARHDRPGRTVSRSSPRPRMASAASRRPTSTCWPSPSCARSWQSMRPRAWRSKTRIGGSRPRGRPAFERSPSRTRIRRASWQAPTWWSIA